MARVKLFFFLLLNRRQGEKTFFMRILFEKNGGQWNADASALTSLEFSGDVSSWSLAENLCCSSLINYHELLPTFTHS